MNQRFHRSLCLLPLLLFLAGCGKSPTTPSQAPAVSTPVPSFGAGSYYLSISQGSNAIDVGGTTFHTTLCLGIGTYPTSVQVPVTVQGEGTSFSIRAANGSLLGELSVQGISVGGRLRGNARDDSGTFSLSVDASDPASLNGALTGDRALSGTVSGSINLAGPNGSGGCSPSTWALTPR